MLILLGNSIVLIPPGVCDIFLWIVLSRQGSSLNAQTYPFRISRRDNDGLRRLSEEIKRDSKWKLTLTKAGTDLRNSWGSLKTSWRCDEWSDGWWVWMFECFEDSKLWWRKEKMILMSLYIRDWKRGGFYPAQILKRNTARWIKTLPLDARSITPPKVLNDVSRIPKRQKQ